MTPELLTVADVADLAQVDPKTVRRAIAGGDLEAMQPTEHGPYRIRRDWYDEWVDARRVSRRRGQSPRPAASVPQTARAGRGRLAVTPGMGRGSEAA